MRFNRLEGSMGFERSMADQQGGYEHGGLITGTGHVDPPTSLDEWLARDACNAVREAWNHIEHNREPLLITGAAGTGKSHLLQLVVSELEGGVVVAAPTGLAALRVGGQTVHSLFRLPPGVLAPTDEVRIPRVLRSISTLVIDEASMVRADLLDAVDRVLRCAQDRRKAFGGVRLILVGDLFQLPPVVDRSEERAFTALGYDGEHVFQARVWESIPLRVVELGQVHRQQDHGFVRMLNAIRCGAAGSDVLQRFSALVARPSSLGVNTGALNLTATRLAAEQENETRLASMPGAATQYAGAVRGEFPLNAMPAPLVLTVKPGARVLFRRNDADRRWVNGTLGTVLDCERGVVHVAVDGRGRRVVVRPVTWEHQTYRRDRRTKLITRTAVGWYRQLPLTLGWATTIHKAQGLTVDRAHIDLGFGAFAAGQLYVALSRCRTFNGISLARPLFASDVMVDERVKDFLHNATATPDVSLW
jgi:ATP-dependent DNA helicase PIF1